MLNLMVEFTEASRSLNFTAGGFCSFANCSSRVNSFMLAVSPIGEVPRRVPSVRLKRSVLDAIPICSINVRPALGTINNASFSDGSIVRRYSPVMVVSTNSILMSEPMPSIYR